MNFIDKKISVQRSISILERKQIIVNEEEAKIILDFLYLISKNYNKPNDLIEAKSQRRFRTIKKAR